MAKEYSDRLTIEQEFTFDQDGNISNPGKFEGEKVYAPYFYNWMLAGEWSSYLKGVYTFDVLEEDWDEFPELRGWAQVELIETEDGFVACQPKKTIDELTGENHPTSTIISMQVEVQKPGLRQGGLNVHWRRSWSLRNAGYDGRTKSADLKKRGLPMISVNHEKAEMIGRVWENVCAALKVKETILAGYCKQWVVDQLSEVDANEMSHSMTAKAQRGEHCIIVSITSFKVPCNLNGANHLEMVDSLNVNLPDLE